MAFKTRELIFIALMAALLFVVNFSLGAGIIATTGIPASSVLITGITNLVVLTFLALTLRRFGGITLMYLIYSLLALPTDMAGGPPGFIWKVPLLTISSLIFEIPLYLTNYRKSGFIIGLPIFTVWGFMTYALAFYLLGLPQLDVFLKALPVLSAVLIVEGYIGMWLGHKIYDRLKDRRIMKQITA